MHNTNPPIFSLSKSSKNKVVHDQTLEVATPPSDQVYILQKRNSQGYFVQIARFNKPVSVEDVKKEFGDGYFVLRSCKPRFSTAWKGWVGEPKLKNDLPARQAREIRSLKHTTDNLVLGEILLGVGEVAGFALTGSSLVDHGLKLNRVESILHFYNAIYPITVLCPTCQHAFSDVLGDFCGNCGTKTIWVNIPQARPGDRSCPYCFYPAKQEQNYCSHCGKALPARPPNSSGARIAPFHPWRLP